ncbi:STAS domain-containing protein [Falsiroseomonas sp. HW251]|uniref:STAS domain-containing protein n=1 Tax=Falsiroseomonas sp. HW251 TaxID=3390998 RepID=UPI003D31E245
MKYEVIELGPAANKVRLTGRLDSDTVGAVEIPFTATIASSGRSVLLDLTELEFMSSLGIRLLLSTSRVVRRRGGHFVMYGARPAVMDVLENLALDAVLPHVATEEEALAVLGA